MKRLAIVSVVVLVVLAAGSMVASKEGERGHRGHGKMGRERHGVVDANAPAVQDANRPGRRVREGWKRVFQARIERLEAIREIAAKEGATKTVAALDGFIAEEKERFRARTHRMRGWRRGYGGEGNRGTGKAEGEGRRRGRWKRATPDADAGS